MNRIPARKGSALLIVLGLLAFMIVSAVGFAAYMRYSRQPSSYLRRSVSTRYLAKAAMAEAIDAIDRAIANNPHPGIGDDQSGGEKLHNFWYHRVFMGTNTPPESIDVAKTVTPLCLEALAYIPPPLVNEARYGFRHTMSGVWQPLGFDTGRYVWGALDVSDYLDVNRLQAGIPRSATSNGRISYAYAFEDAQHMKNAGKEAQAWDAFLEKEIRQVNQQTGEFDTKSAKPLISMADFNLALEKQGGVGEMTSPFCDYLKKDGKGGFYGTTARDVEERIRNMTLITDSVLPLPDPNAKNEMGDLIRNLNDGQYQPFDPSVLKNAKTSLGSILTGEKVQSANTMNWTKYITGLGVAALYDYLDPDHVPLSLAIPTTERVPMFCGIETTFEGASLGVTKEWMYKDGDKNEPHPDGSGVTINNNAPPQGPEDTRIVEQVVTYRISNQDLLKGFMTGNVRSLVCFPFAHSDPADASSFMQDGRFSLFFTSGDVSLRAGTRGTPFALPKDIQKNGLDENGLINVTLPEKNISFKGTVIKEEKQALKMQSSPLVTGQAEVGTQLKLEGNELLRVKYSWTQTAKEVGGNAGGLNVKKEYVWVNKWDDVKGLPDTIANAHCGIKSTVWQGGACDHIDDELAEDGKLTKLIRGGNGRELTLRAAVWLRMKEGDKVVDMVPASTNDDKTQNDITGGKPIDGAIVASYGLGANNPLMLLQTGVSFNLSIAGLDALAAQAQEIKISPKRMIVADPRYNHAPEHWFRMPGDEALSAEAWLKNNETGTSGSGRDNDIFMATSDAGYLQSKYEMAFLPRFSNLSGTGNHTSGFYQAPDGKLLHRIPDSFGETSNQDMAWKTFDPLNDNRKEFRDLPWSNESRGLRVNPYSDSTNVLMAAFANTPRDWKFASTNFTLSASQAQSGTGAKPGTVKVDEFNKKYAFNAYTEDQSQKLMWNDLTRVAGRLIDEVRVGNGSDWEDAWDRLPWADTSTEHRQFFGKQLDTQSATLWTADRKYLYGFWRDCFAAKQQLFLVFVRAEPMMMGGGAGGQMPPQYGSRAVALVWRDPTKSGPRGQGNKGSTPAPHQTRVLFYRQFE